MKAKQNLEAPASFQPQSFFLVDRCPVLVYRTVTMHLEAKDGATSY